MTGFSKMFVPTFVVLLITASHLSVAFMSHEFSSNRYFTDKGVLPPLNGVGLTNLVSNQTSEIYTTDTSSYLSGLGPSVPVTYTNDPKTVYRWMSDNLPNEGCTLGFDVESLPRMCKKNNLKRSPFHGAATVQLATADSCLVIHLARRSGKHSRACTPILKAVLCDEQFVKAGCAVDEDLMSLSNLWGGLDAKSRLDLGFLGGYERIGNPFGLKTLSKRLLGVDLPKPQEIAISDWSAVPLSEAQIVYGARDAWAGAAIAKKLADYDPDTFSHKSLVSLLPPMETSIAKLVSKQKRRDQARTELRRLMLQFPDKVLMPDHIQIKARDLRERIKARVMEPRLVFEVDHLCDL